MSSGFLYKTNKIMLRPFVEEDSYNERYQQWFFDPDVTRYNSHGLFPYTEAERESFVSKINKREIIVFAIHPVGDEEGKTHIGNISLQSINWIYRSAEIAWVIGDKEYWRKGIATEVGELMLYHAFDCLNLYRIWSGTASTNKGMQRVFDKLGFMREGVFTDGMFLDGEYVDIYNYFVLKKMWEKRKHDEL